MVLSGERGITGLSVDGAKRTFAAVIVAVSWRRVCEVLGSQLAATAGVRERAAQVGSSSISSLHLWFDRPLTSLPHAVLVDRLSQWIFARPSAEALQQQAEAYYQVVISASRELLKRRREEIRDEVLGDLKAVFPAARNATLLRWRLVNQRDAVFSMTPGLDALRPVQATPVAGLFLAGDWTQTTWPATMEGAVRSGYLAAEAVLRGCGREVSLVLPEPRHWLARRLFRVDAEADCNPGSDTL
jgi:protoporphyrinogen oxidase